MPQKEKMEKSVVDLYGQLQVKGNKVVDKNSNPVALYGMSLFWSQWIGKYYNYNCIKWLHDDWKCTIVRAAMAVGQGGYLTNPQIEMAKIRAVIDACIDLGMYVIVDWHTHHAEDHVAEAKTFFSQIARLYGDKPNVIYEIYNEPLQVSWSNVVKPYAEEVIQEIRAIDPDNLIVVGTPTWSQDVDVAANDSLKYHNIAYALHFYAGTHKEWLRTRAMDALNRGIALFVTEWGTPSASGDGPMDLPETQSWLRFMDQHHISWCNWSVAHKNETTSVLKSGASEKSG